METEIKNNIFYRPELNIEKNYQSDAKVLYTNTGATTDSSFSNNLTEDALYIDTSENLDPQIKKYGPRCNNQAVLDKNEEVLENLISIKNILPILPTNTSLQEVLDDIVEKLIFQTIIEQEKLKELVKQDLIDDKNNTYLITTVTGALNSTNTKDDSISSTSNSTNSTASEDNNSNISKPSETEVSTSSTKNENVIIDGFELGFPEPMGMTINYIECKPEGKMALEQYIKDSTLIKEEFTMKMNGAIQKYLYPITTFINDAGVSKLEYLNYEYDGEAVTGYDLNSTHLHDSIVKNQIILNEKSKMFEKTHDSDTTLSTITAFDIIAQERINYYTESKLKNSEIKNYLELFKNELLEKSQMMYDYKYRKAKINMYKYLNSAVIITSDILEKCLDSNISKCYLLTKDVNIFARKEYDSIVNSTKAENNSDESKK